MTPIRILLIALTMASGFGCRVCQTCDEYPAYGGSWQRTNRVSGRVGSVFDPAGAKVASYVEDRATPEVPDPVVEDDRFGDTEPTEEANSVLDEDDQAPLMPAE